MRARIAIMGGYPLLMNLYEPYKRRINEYNLAIRDSGYYLKPIHFVYIKLPNERTNPRYVYFGRYWYRVHRLFSPRKRGSKIRWIYIGKEKPDPSLPDPPLNPFEGLHVIAVEGDLLVDEKSYRALTRISEGLHGTNIFGGNVIDLSSKLESKHFWSFII